MNFNHSYLLLYIVQQISFLRSALTTASKEKRIMARKMKNFDELFFNRWNFSKHISDWFLPLTPCTEWCWPLYQDKCIVIREPTSSNLGKMMREEKMKIKPKLTIIVTSSYQSKWALALMLAIYFLDSVDLQTLHILTRGYWQLRLSW